MNILPKIVKKKIFAQNFFLKEIICQKNCDQNFTWRNKFFPTTIFCKKNLLKKMFTNFFLRDFFFKNIFTEKNNVQQKKFLKNIFWIFFPIVKIGKKKFRKKKICRKKVHPKLFLLRNSYLWSKYSLHITLEAEIWH